MGKIDLFAVEISGEKRDFFPGEIICGEVLLKVNKELTVREIRVEFYGEAKVHWTEAIRAKKDRKKGRKLRDYTNYEQYLNIAATVFGKAPGQVGDNPVLSPGHDYSFPFEFQIPEENLPTTFEGKHGHVTYWLKAIIDRPWKSNVETKEAFTVTERVDVNDPEFLVPCQLQDDRNLGCLCCVSGPLSVTVQTDRGAYCPGEVLMVTTYVNNQTSYRITGVEMEMIQDVVFISSGGTRTSITEVLATVIKSRKTTHSENSDWFEMVPLTIPSLPPTMSSCSCIKISYHIKVTVLVRGSVNSCLRIPVTVGSIPYEPPAGRAIFSSLKRSGSSASSTAGFSGHPSFSSGSLMYTDGIRPYPNEAPPSYAESVNTPLLRQDGVFYGKEMEMESLIKN